MAGKAPTPKRASMAGLVEFEAGLGQIPPRKAKKVLSRHKEGVSYRRIGCNVGLSKNTIMRIIRRAAIPA